ncbi:DMT family transporter [Candidatus Woesearchaeota archaeon]|nr:DMT family transporter [Candidatus Woesearchaeota archaeon]
MISQELLFVIILTTLAYTSVYIIDKFIVSKKASNVYAYTVVSVSIFWIESIILAFFLNWTGITLLQLWKPFIAGIISGAFYITYFYILNKDEASHAVPLMYLSPIGLTLIHFLFLKSSFTIYQLLGIGGATLGVIILESRHTIKQFFHSKTTLFGIGYGLLVGIPIAINEAASQEIFFWNIQPIFATGSIISVSILLIRKDVRMSILKHYKLVKYTVISEALTITGNIAFWYGITLIGAPLLSGISQITPLILFTTTTVISRYYPHIIEEDQQRTTLLRKTIAITLIVLGTGMIVYAL